MENEQYAADVQEKQAAMNALQGHQPVPLTEEQIHGIARVCHEANRAYCLLLDDNTQQSWEQSQDWQKASAIEGVKIHLQQPWRVNDAAWSHENWMEHKLKDGWRWGPKKDAEKKEHPSLLPYRMLSETEKSKDTLFSVIAHIISTTLDPRKEQIVGQISGLAKRAN